MANLPGLVIKIGANTKDAIDGLNRVNRAVGQSASAADKSAAKWSQFKKVFAGLGVGAGVAVAVNQLQAMASAAAEDEKSVVSLQKALSNVGLGTAADEAEDFVKQLMLATGIADNDLRNSLQTLTTATGDFAQAQRLVQVAMDASEATGRDLGTTSLALAKASQGNIGALTRLGIPLDANIVKAKDFNAALAIMEDRFSGQAAAAADTYAGKMRRVTMAVGEAQETIGYELLASLDAVSEALGGTDGAISGVAALGDEAAASIRPLREIADTINDLTGGIDVLGGVMQATVNTLGGPFTSAWMKWGRDLRASDADAGDFAEHLGDVQQHFMNLGVDAGILGRDYQLLADDTDSQTGAFKRQRTAVEQLADSLGKLNGKNRSVIGGRLALRQMRAEGPGSTGGKKGNVVTSDDKLAFGLDYAQQVEALAQALTDRGQTAAARRTLQRGNKYLSGFVGDDRADDLLSTPAWLDRGNKAQRTAGDRMSGTTNNYYFGDLMVRDAADAAEQAKRAARLKGLGAGRVAEAARYSAMAGAA